jgi:iron complex outermembrane receptor protein
MAWVRNLTDEDYYPSAYAGGNGPYVRTWGMPRTYGVTFSYAIGQ